MKKITLKMKKTNHTYHILTIFKYNDNDGLLSYIFLFKQFIKNFNILIIYSCLNIVKTKQSKVCKEKYAGKKSDRDNK